jgi:hypothetical protein
MGFGINPHLILLISVRKLMWQVVGETFRNFQRVRLAPPNSKTFLSEQTNHQQPANNTFLSEQISTKHQQLAKRTTCRWNRGNLPMLKSMHIPVFHSSTLYQSRCYSYNSNGSSYDSHNPFVPASENVFEKTSKRETMERAGSSVIPHVFTPVAYYSPFLNTWFVNFFIPTLITSIHWTS